MFDTLGTASTYTYIFDTCIFDTVAAIDSTYFGIKSGFNNHCQFSGGITAKTLGIAIVEVLTHDAVGTDQISLDCLTTHLVTSNTGVAADAFGLADGYDGQEKIIVYKTETEGGDTGVVTPVSFYDGTTITFDTAGEFVKLFFTNGDWKIIVNNGGTVA